MFVVCSETQEVDVLCPLYVNPTHDIFGRSIEMTNSKLLYLKLYYIYVYNSFLYIGPIV